MKRISKMVQKCVFSMSSVVATLALVVISTNVNAACSILIHQPKMPESAKKLRKF